MTKDEAIDIITERIAIDVELLDGDTESDYAKFIIRQDEAMQMALDALKERRDTDG